MTDTRGCAAPRPRGHLQFAVLLLVGHRWWRSLSRSCRHSRAPPRCGGPALLAYRASGAAPTNLQEHARAGAQAIVEVLARQAGSRRAAVIAPDLEQLNRLLPGLGPPASLHLTRRQPCGRERHWPNQSPRADRGHRARHRARRQQASWSPPGARCCNPTTCSPSPAPPRRSKPPGSSWPARCRDPRSEGSRVQEPVNPGSCSLTRTHPAGAALVFEAGRWLIAGGCNGPPSTCLRC